MDVLSWLWLTVTTVAGILWSLVWFLIGGWVSTLLQITLLIAVIYYLKYGWRKAPFEIWRRTSAFARFFWSWIRAREAPAAASTATREVVRVVRTKEFGDLNISTLLSLLMLAGLLLVARV